MSLSESLNGQLSQGQHRSGILFSRERPRQPLFRADRLLTASLNDSPVKVRATRRRFVHHGGYFSSEHAKGHVTTFRTCEEAQPQLTSTWPSLFEVIRDHVERSVQFDCLFRQ